MDGTSQAAEIKTRQYSWFKMIFYLLSFLKVAFSKTDLYQQVKAL